LNLSFR